MEYGILNFLLNNERVISNLKKIYLLGMHNKINKITAKEKIFGISKSNFSKSYKENERTVHFKCKYRFLYYILEDEKSRCFVV